MQPTWTAVDAFAESHLHPPDAALRDALEDATAAGMPEIQVSAGQGALLGVLTRAIGARRVLEIGTLGGYSTIWIARALPADGELTSLEIDPRHAAVARRSVERAGPVCRVEVVVGPALETLPGVIARSAGPFDMVFIDADKENAKAYFDLARGATRPGGLIIVDNAVRRGELSNASSDDPATRALRHLVTSLRGDDAVTASVVQTVGTKGYDGFLIAVV